MANQRAPSEMTITRIANDLKVPCLGCALGKHTRSEQSKEDTSQSAPSEEIGSVVCMDLKGKIKPRDRLGNQYLAVFVDHASGFTAAVPIKKKSEAERECKTFINALERAHNVVIKVLRSDRGGEFLSAKFKSYLEDKGITHQTTQGSTSASNGKAERMIRTLMDATRTMIFDCDLPPTFWSDAAKHAAYLRNRVPTRSNAGYLSPLEMLTGKAPKVNHLLRFGSDCTVHAPPAHRGIITRGELGRVLGVNPTIKGYDIWVPRLGKVLTTRDVQNVTYTRASTRLSDVPESDLSFNRVQSKTTATKETPTSTKRVHFTRSTAGANASMATMTAEEPRAPRSPVVYDGDEGSYALIATITKDPKTVREALSGPNAAKWTAAMKAEIDSLIANGTWMLVPKPPGTNIVSNKWVFKIKYDSLGAVEKFKARLVARGFSQQYGVDFSETYSPVIKQAAVRFIFIVATLYGGIVEHLDVPQAYVRTNIDTPIHMEVPAMVDGDPETQALLLLKGLYGLKQSGRLWNKDINDTILSLGYQKSKLDACLYFKTIDGKVSLLGLYVDDIFLFVQNAALREQTLGTLKAKYDIKSLGRATRCLGTNVHSDEQGHFLEQTSLVDELLAKFNLTDCHGSRPRSRSITDMTSRAVLAISRRARCARSWELLPG
ncbi:hypothetical protein Ae201684_009741 [Aphanomyces euteiches]|uniref:Integrase catalytic domain-containing protein n=1 Tax=Aphanomyces euteiches TaxID=100861 RepID=A0A6G0X0Y7_9STRA|nr:hypothetical protein Ae201684_009741 [Aphanomyces euteiches]